MRVWCWPGNASDTTVLPEVRDGMRDWNLGRLITVVDRGFSSHANVDYLRKGGGQRIAGMKMRDKSADAAKGLSRPGRYTDVDDHLRVKEVSMETATPGVRWVVCHNKAEAAKDAKTRQDALDYLTGELERIAAARTRTSTALKAATTEKAKTRLEADLAGHSRSECALRDHVTLGRWLRQTATGRLVIDTKTVSAEAKLDGKYLLSTSDAHLSPAEAAVGYKNLLKAERGFRDMKTGLLLRPVFHRLEPRIKAHVLICWLALLLTRVAEEHTGDTWASISTHMSRLSAVTLTSAAGTCRPPNRPTSNGHYWPPARYPHRPGSPPLTPSDQGKHRFPGPFGPRKTVDTRPRRRPGAFPCLRPGETRNPCDYPLRNPGFRSTRASTLDRC